MFRQYHPATPRRKKSRALPNPSGPEPRRLAGNAARNRSGFLGGTLEGLQADIIQRALHEHVTIDSIDARGLYTEGPGIPLSEMSDLVRVPLPMYQFQKDSKMSEQFEEEAPLANLAHSTGGLFFHNNNDLALGFNRLGLTPSITYALSFSPASLPADGKFHKLQVEVSPDKHYTVQARRGYFDPQASDGKLTALTCPVTVH